MLDTENSGFQNCFFCCFFSNYFSMLLPKLPQCSASRCYETSSLRKLVSVTNNPTLKR